MSNNYRVYTRRNSLGWTSSRWCGICERQRWVVRQRSIYGLHEQCIWCIPGWPRRLHALKDIVNANFDYFHQDVATGAPQRQFKLHVDCLQYQSVRPYVEFKLNCATFSIRQIPHMNWPHVQCEQTQTHCMAQPNNDCVNALPVMTATEGARVVMQPFLLPLFLSV